MPEETAPHTGCKLWKEKNSNSKINESKMQLSMSSSSSSCLCALTSWRALVRPTTSSSSYASHGQHGGTQYYGDDGDGFRANQPIHLSFVVVVVVILMQLERKRERERRRSRPAKLCLDVFPLRARRSTVVCARAPLRTQTPIPPLEERGCCATLFRCVRVGGGGEGGEEEAAQKTHHRILSRSSHAPHLSTQLTLELACSSPPKSTINDCGAHFCGFLLFEGCFLLNSFTNDQLR